MNKRALLLFLVSFLLCAGFSLSEAKRPTTLTIGNGEAKVNFLEGDSKVLEKGERAWQPLKLADILGEGDEVQTGKGARVELLLPDNSRLRFAENSAIRVVRMESGSPSKPRDVNVHLALGKAWSNVIQTVGVKGNFELASDKAVTGVRGTVYRMNVEQDRSALVRVYDGIVYVTSGEKTPERPMPGGPPTRVSGPKPIPGPHRVTMEEWTIIIKAMQQVRIGADGIPDKPRDFTESEDRDEWVDWNRARDRNK
jgi:hypothetical protein